MRRRSLLQAMAGGAATSITEHAAVATSRTPYGGQITLHVPWPLGRIDPHSIDDAMAACFGTSLFDALYERDERGSVRPALADGLPEPEGGALRVRIRPAVRFASGQALDATIAAASIERARARGASAWLAGVPPARADSDGLHFAMGDSAELIRALCSPMVAVLPPHFTPERPDGTGPFRVQTHPDGGLRLTRNSLAAGGPAYLEAVNVLHSADLVTSLRAFESGADDLGWLGSFLHEPRIGAGSFDAGAIAWAILRTGREAGALDVPGMAQALANGVRHETLAPLVVGPQWEETAARWTGAPCDLLVRDDAPWLVELARIVAAATSSPSHEIAARPAPPADVLHRRIARAYALMMDVACPAGPGDLGTLIGLATANDASTARALALHPPRALPSPRVATRTMRLGVVGEIRLQGGRAQDVVLPPSGWGRGLAWGDAFRRSGGA